MEGLVDQVNYSGPCLLGTPLHPRKSVHSSDIIMYFDEMVHTRVSLKQRCPLIGGVVQARAHCTHIEVLISRYKQTSTKQ